MPAPATVSFPPGLSAIWLARYDGSYSLSDQGMTASYSSSTSMIGPTAGSYHNLNMGLTADPGNFQKNIWGRATAQGGTTDLPMSNWVNYAAEAPIRLGFTATNNTDSHTINYAIYLDAYDTIYETGISGTISPGNSIALVAIDTHQPGWSLFSDRGYRINMALSATFGGGGKAVPCYIAQDSCIDSDGVGAPGTTARGFSTNYSGWNLHGNPITGTAHWMVAKNTSGSFIDWNKRTDFELTFTN